MLDNDESSHYEKVYRHNYKDADITKEKLTITLFILKNDGKDTYNQLYSVIPGYLKFKPGSKQKAGGIYIIRNNINIGSPFSSIIGKDRNEVDFSRPELNYLRLCISATPYFDAEMGIQANKNQYDISDRLKEFISDVLERELSKEYPGKSLNARLINCVNNLSIFPESVVEEKEYKKADNCINSILEGNNKQIREYSSDDYKKKIDALDNGINSIHEDKHISIDKKVDLYREYFEEGEKEKLEIEARKQEFFNDYFNLHNNSKIIKKIETGRVIKSEFKTIDGMNMPAVKSEKEHKEMDLITLFARLLIDEKYYPDWFGIKKMDTNNLTNGLDAVVELTEKVYNELDYSKRVSGEVYYDCVDSKKLERDASISIKNHRALVEFKAILYFAQPFNHSCFLCSHIICWDIDNNQDYFIAEDGKLNVEKSDREGIYIAINEEKKYKLKIVVLREFLKGLGKTDKIKTVFKNYNKK